MLNLQSTESQSGLGPSGKIPQKSMAGVTLELYPIDSPISNVNFISNSIDYNWTAKTRSVRIIANFLFGIKGFVLLQTLMD